MFAIAAIISATLIYSQLLTLVSAMLLLATTLFSFSGYSTLSYSHLQLLDSCLSTLSYWTELLYCQLL